MSSCLANEQLDEHLQHELFASPKHPTLGLQKNVLWATKSLVYRVFMPLTA